ncbi:hypothetical protein [Vibrio sp. SCSIO 43169]|nr:hypothetical protein [Vibrio sp. SCSIO 43169]
MKRVKQCEEVEALPMLGGVRAQLLNNLMEPSGTYDKTKAF